MISSLIGKRNHRRQAVTACMTTEDSETKELLEVLSELVANGRRERDRDRKEALLVVLPSEFAAHELVGSGAGEGVDEDEIVQLEEGIEL